MLDLATGTIVCVIFFSNTIYGLASPFLPAILNDMGIAASWTGLIFAAYAISMFFVSPIVGKCMDKVGHAKIMCAGTLLMSLSIASFGLAQYVDGNEAVIAGSIGLRVLQGAASSMINTSAYSFAAQAHPEDVEKFVSIFEGFVGLGCVAGPVIGSLVYEAVGFDVTFFIFGGLMAPVSILVICALPSTEELKKMKARDHLIEGEDEELDAEIIPKTKLTYSQLICIPRVMFAATGVSIMCIVYGVFEPTLSLRLQDYTRLNQTQKGLIFAIQPLMYMILVFAYPWICPKWIEHRVSLITMAFFLGMTTFLVGPFFEPLGLYVMLVGLFLSGIFLGPLVIPNMAEMMRSAKLVYPDSDLDHANSLLSGILNCCFGAGQAIGPLLGSAVYQVSGFRMMCDVAALIALAYALLYLLFGTGCQAFKQTFEAFAKRNDVKELTLEEEIEDEACSIRHSSHFKQSIISTGRARALSKCSVLVGSYDNATGRLMSSQRSGRTMRSQRYNSAYPSQDGTDTIVESLDIAENSKGSFNTMREDQFAPNLTKENLAKTTD